MAPKEQRSVSGQFVLPVADLDESIGFFRDRLGFRLDVIFPADAPRIADMSAQGLRIRLDSSAPSGEHGLRIESTPDVLRQLTADDRVMLNGLPVELVGRDEAVSVPSLVPELFVSASAGETSWSAGRAGMQYRDLIPGRLGGAVIASHIRIPDGGPVPDYVHHHHVRFQLIYCLRGSVRLVYEDQGPPFVMQAGDCVLQPPHIRHRVLECSDGFEVVEVGCPAEHETLVEHDLALPTDVLDAKREYSGQRFAFHRAAGAPWVQGAGIEIRDTGLADASGGAVHVRVCRPDSAAGIRLRPSLALCFGFVCVGAGTLRVGSSSFGLDSDSSFVLPAGTECVIEDYSSDFEWLEVTADL